MVFISLLKNMIEYITVPKPMAESISFILSQFSDTRIFLSLDGFLVFDGKKLTDSGCLNSCLKEARLVVNINCYVVVKKITFRRIRTHEILQV